MVNICLQCGDKGFSNALVYCVNCLQYAVHRYCLNKVPATFDEFVYWFCDDCDVEMPQHFGPLLNTEPIQLKNGDYVNSKHGKPNSEERSFKRKKTGNMVLDTADNLPQDQSPEDDFPRKMDTRRKIKKVSDSIMEHNRHQSGDVNAELDTSVNYNQGAEFCPLNKSNKKKRVVSTLSTDLQGRTPPEQPGFGLGHLSGDGTLYNYELAQPLADPIWRGSFNVLNRDYDEFEGMVAHLSKKACQKAYEEARLFPALLDLTMYPKLDIWPKSFERSEPSDDNIALYFFPMRKRYERTFDHLVEQMMNDELAMKVILQNAELLIFTSRELPLNYWRFQGKYYLWGVFRGKQRPPAYQHNDVGVKNDAKPPTEMNESEECIDSSPPLSNCTDA